MCTLLDLCVSSLRRGHANLLCIVPILTDDPRRESKRGRVPRQRMPLHGEGNGGSAFLWVLISEIKQSSSVACAPGHLDFSRSDTRGGDPEHLDFSHSDGRGGGPGQVIIAKLCRHSHGEPRKRKHAFQGPYLRFRASAAATRMDSPRATERMPALLGWI